MSTRRFSGATTAGPDRNDRSYLRISHRQGSCCMESFQMGDMLGTYSRVLIITVAARAAPFPRASSGWLGEV